jgi:predicted AAA+ superfamily ATPase
MPALVSGQYEDRSAVYAGYISTYLERDVRDLSGAIDALKFMRFVTSVAARDAQLVNYKGIADDADIDQYTVKGWLNILETLGIIFYLHPYSNNVLKRTIKTPKLYFCDTGLVCYLTRWSSPETAMNGAMSGALLENYTVVEIIKSYHNCGREPFIYYYRDRDAKEIDLIIEGDGKLCPVEIKKTAMPDKRLTNVFTVIDKSPLQRGTGAVICMAEHFSAFDRDNLIVPIWMI